MAVAVLVAVIAAGAIAGAVATVGGLPDPSIVDRLLGSEPAHDAVEARVSGRMRPDGVVIVRHEVRFTGDDGGVLTLERPCPGGEPRPFACLLDPRVDGRPASFTERAARTEISVQGRSAVVTYELWGAVAGFTDIGVLEWSVLPREFGTPATGAFDVRVTLDLPRAPRRGTVDARLHGMGPDPAVSVRGDRISFAGTVQGQVLDVAMHVAFPVGLVPGLDPLRTAGIAGRGIFETAEDARDRADATVAPFQGVDETVRRVMRVVVLAFGFGIPALLWIIVAVSLVNRARRRRLPVPDEPTYEDRPPSAHDPAMVALLMGDGEPGREAVSGAILRLAGRNEIELQDLAGEAFSLAVKPEAMGTTAGESLLLATLRTFASEEGGRVTGPPLFKRPVGLWKSFRGDVLARAEAEGLVHRAVSLGLVLSAVVLTAVGFGLVYGPVSPALFFPAAIVVPIVALALTLRLGRTLSDRGRMLRARWEAYGRHLRDRTAMGDAPPAGVVIWGDQLAYGAVLGVAPTAARLLAPPG